MQRLVLASFTVDDRITAFAAGMDRLRRSRRAPADATYDELNGS